MKFPSFILRAGQTMREDLNNNIRIVAEQCPPFIVKCCGKPTAIANASAFINTWVNQWPPLPKDKPVAQLATITRWHCLPPDCPTCSANSSHGLDNHVIAAPVAITTCCNRSIAFGIWVFLSLVDEEELKIRARVNVASEPMDLHDKPKPPKSSGIGYFATETHYYGPKSNTFLVQSSTPKPLVEQDLPDDFLAANLWLLTALVANLNNCSQVDIEFAASMFRLSRLFDTVAALLRNDSVEDVTQRKNVYSSLFGFIRTLAQVPLLADLLFETRLGMNGSPGLLYFSTPDAFKYNLIDHSLSPIFKCAEDLFRQCRSFNLQLGRSGRRLNEHDKGTVKLCGELLRAYEDMRARSGQVPTPSPDPSNLLTDLAERWKVFCRDNKVTYTDDILNFHRHKERFKTKSSTAMGRMSTLSKEIAIMSTSLPNGIFLKVAESRLDVMKFLVVGVEGSPYAGGLFIFDMFLDTKWPAAPPIVEFVLTTADYDGANFNPNLHRGGQVCLSLLNTWSGSREQMWQPNKSTLLSVLVSIQAMILGAPFPYLNEPGFESKSNRPECLQYNKDLQCKTVKNAMIYWLDGAFKSQKPNTETIWKDIAEEYWKCNGSTVFEGVQEWAKENKMLHNFTIASPMLQGALLASYYKNIEKEASAVGVDLVAGLKVALECGSSGITQDAASKRTTFHHFAPHIGPFLAPVAGTPSTGQSTGSTGLTGGQPALPGQLFSMLLPDGLEVLQSAHQFDEGNEEKFWSYTGEKNMKELRAACKDFGVKNAKSIKDTLARLESFVNSSNAMVEKPGLCDKWGASNVGSEAGVGNSLDVDVDMDDSENA